MDVLWNPFDPSKYFVVEPNIVSVSLGVQFEKKNRKGCRSVFGNSVNDGKEKLQLLYAQR